MNRNMWMAIAIASATTVAAAGQTPATTTSSSKMDDKDTVKVTGCLQADTGSGSASTTSGSYVLSNAMMGTGSTSTTGSTAGTTTPPPASSTAGTTGTTGTTASDAAHNMNMSYVLDGHDSELKNHVGHRIEVTGTIEGQDRSGSSSATSTTTSGSASSRMAGGDRLKVSSVRMIAADCSSK